MFMIILTRKGGWPLVSVMLVTAAVVWWEILPLILT